MELPRPEWLREEHEYTDAELAAFGEYVEAQNQGRVPDAEEFLTLHPEHAESLRPALEAADWFDALVQDFRLKHPGFRTWHLFRRPDAD